MRNASDDELSAPAIRWSEIAFAITAPALLWFAIGYLAPGRIFTHWDATTQAQRGQLGDQFGAVNALFTGLALAGVIVSVMMQRRMDARNRAQFASELAAQAGQLTSTLYSSHLHSLLEHVRQFAESPHYRLARDLAWNCVQRAFFDVDFRARLATSSHLEPKIGSRRLYGHFVRTRHHQVAEPGDTPVYSWNSAAHFVDDLSAFFSALAIHIRSIELLHLDGTQRATFEGLMRSLRVYWNWWGPALRYVSHLRTEDYRTSGHPFPPHHDALDGNFDLLDRCLLGVEHSTRMEASTTPMLLESLYGEDFSWQDCDPRGTCRQQPRYSREQAFSLELIGVRLAPVRGDASFGLASPRE